MMKFARSISIALVCVVLGAMLSWQYRSINSEGAVDAIYSEGLGDLRDELIEEKRINESLKSRNEELQNQLSEYKNAIDDVEMLERTIIREIERAEIIAGLVDVKGDGVVITVDADMAVWMRRPYSFGELINDLKASEAQAISINDERVVAMSEIKGVEDFTKWMINGRQYMPPFTIKVIGDPVKLDNSLHMLEGIVDMLRRAGYQISVEKKEDIVIPAIRDDGSVLKYDLLSPVD
ncbi:DUF881 domain-containing protein [Herbivorax sp. ANBcel31]|uniref:DUF881 domain-containing protein n=1 Tax=Herbivorax sp. ANBcel31 TaxID=3069754 RepID=UPI0027B21777|nr:DUF881 domain-containing protein [Herbivorax sp. ANBcel31]MDQ2085976.1 DUF881 domain-containing protein [Herbivorax sp. ANBcel31]